MTPNHNTSNKTSKTFGSSQSKGFKTDSDRKEFKKSLTIDTDYLRDPFQELENSDLNDQSDWWQSESFPPEIQNLFEFINNRQEDENGDDLNYLTFKVKEFQLAPLFIGACLRNIKFKKLWEKKYSSFNHYCVDNFGFKAHHANNYIKALNIALIFLRYRLSPDSLPRFISHYEPLNPFIDNPDLLVAKWNEILNNFTIDNLNKSNIQSMLNPKISRRKYSTKIDLGNTTLSNYIEIIAKLERIKPGTVIKRLFYRTYGHIVPLFQRLINDSKNQPITEEILSVFRADYKELNDNFTPWFPNST